MNNPLIKLLIIESDSADTQFIRESLMGDQRLSFHIFHAENLEAGLELIGKEPIDIVLLDLFLPDNHGLGTVVKLQTYAPSTPFVILTSLDDETIAVEAVRRGAQDYLIKGQVNSKMLSRIIRYALERHRMQLELRTLAFIDPLTSLYNRRGFLTLAEQQLRLARRMKRKFLIILVDLDGFKHINDTFGHLEGDQALVGVSDILRNTFRASDIIARVGGDEFVVLALEALQDNMTELVGRLGKNLKDCSAQKSNPYKISLSVGVSCFDPDSELSIDHLMMKADKALYENKRSKKLVFDHVRNTFLKEAACETHFSRAARILEADGKSPH